MIFGLVTSMEQRKNSEFPWGSEPQTFGFHTPMLLLYHRDSRVSMAYCKEKTSFLYIFVKLKTYHFSYSIYKTWQ